MTNMAKLEWDSPHESGSSSWSDHSDSSPSLYRSQTDYALSPLLLTDTGTSSDLEESTSSSFSMEMLFDWDKVQAREAAGASDFEDIENRLLNGIAPSGNKVKGEDSKKGVESSSPNGVRKPTFEESMLRHNIKVCPFDNAIHYGGLVDTGDIREFDCATLSTSDLLFSREYAELSFICRVLDMALDTRMPILDRWLFCCIVSSLLDEQFAKRLGSIPRFDEDEEETGDKARMLKSQVRPRSDFEDNLTTAVKSIVGRQHQCLLEDLIPALKRKGVQILTADQLTGRESEYLHTYFITKVHPLLTPMSFDATHPFPLLHSHGLYIAIVMADREAPHTRKKVYFRIPADVTRLLPVDSSNLRYAPVEQVIIDNAALICQGVRVLESHTFRVTRNTKLIIDDSNFLDRENLLNFVYEEVHRRRSAPATRLEVHSSMPDYLREELRMELYLDKPDVYTVPGPLVDLASCESLAFTVPLPGSRRPRREPSTPPSFRGLDEKLQSEPGAIFGVIRERDILVQYPHHKFATTALLFLRSAARDPKVKSVKMVIYRGGKNSPIIPTLIRAAKNGKEVTVIVELKASFDEVQNSEYVRKLHRAGCNVTYGLVGLKTHCKAILVIRHESDDSLRPYVNVATGNFNPSTAKLYTDLSLFTAKQNICDDVVDLFNTLTGFSPQAVYRHLLVAPGSMLSTFVSLINEEAAIAQSGRSAIIVCQVNGLTEPRIAEALYNASRAGVKIQLIVRGSCRLRPGIPGISENVQIFSWVGHVLQHRRVWYFCANGEHKYYIGSADWRSRNLNDRIEVVVPVEDRRIKRKLARSLESLLHDPGIWRMSVDGRYYKPADPDVLKTTARFKETMKQLKRKRRLRPKLIGDESLDNISCTGSSDSPKKVDIGKPKRTYHVNIRGNEVTVDKIKAGAAMVRFYPPETPKLQVLLVWRDDDDNVQTPSPQPESSSPTAPSSPTLLAPVEEPVWSVVKGTIKDQEDASATAFRLARVKAGVLEAKRIGSIGWVYRPRRTKKTAVSVIVLEVEDEGEAEEVRGLRARNWFEIGEAIQWASKHKDAFLRDVLSRTKHSAMAFWRARSREEAEALNNYTDSMVTASDKNEKSVSTVSEDPQKIKERERAEIQAVDTSKNEFVLGKTVQ